jgi:hypothetical protein
MTRTLLTLPKAWVALPGLLVLAFLLAGLAFHAGSSSRPARFAIVADSASGTSPSEAAAAVRARERATGADGQFRITRTPTEALSVTHLLAAEGYDTVIVDGVDERVAVAPVAERFPGTRFITR